MAGRATAPIIVAGDFNAQHQAWGYAHSTRKGKNLWQAAADLGLTAPLLIVILPDSFLLRTPLSFVPLLLRAPHIASHSPKYSDYPKAVLLSSPFIATPPPVFTPARILKFLFLGRNELRQGAWNGSEPFYAYLFVCRTCASCSLLAGFADIGPDADPEASKEDHSGGDLWQHVVDSDMGGRDICWDDFVTADDDADTAEPCTDEGIVNEVRGKSDSAESDDDNDETLEQAPTSVPVAIGYR
ncbi:hypothetical protein HPB50_007229 [Hyalomma asiaticum]|uniref:Uncharacterized protein n=1 Tax=Hyalomma asiaticum TaxID=266040 RepID=A0ACB7SVX4_HYAAI|nr:hypothetical protein HPB50_007229 [Hyalomma asiaticum]